MAGLLEDMMTKMDTLIVSLNENTKARLAGETGGGAADDKPATTRTRKPKEDTAAGPKTTEAALVAKFDELKNTDTDKRMPRLKKIIADLGFSALKELRVTPAKFDEAMAALEAYEAELAAEGAGGDEDDDL